MYYPIQVVFADDHEIFRSGFKLLFKNQKEIELVGEAENGIELLQVVEEQVPHVVLTDIQMPKLDGIEACRLISENHKIPVLALTTFNDDSYILEMLRAGAKGYLLKNTNQTELIQAVKMVHQGNSYYCGSTSQKINRILAQHKSNPNNWPVSLTERELDIIKLICKQKSNKEIAALLSISKRTVETHRIHIQEKIGSKNASGIIMYAIKHKICHVDECIN